MTSLIERMAWHMPYFVNSHHRDFGKITVTPKSLLRRVRVAGYSPLPYMTMNKIRFTLRVEKIPEQVGVFSNARRVFIELGNRSYRPLQEVTKLETDVEGVAEYTGDTKFFIAPADYSIGNSQKFISKEGILLFDDNVLSVNHYVWGWVGMIVVAIVSPICLWLLSSLIQIPAILRILVR